MNRRPLPRQGSALPLSYVPLRARYSCEVFMRPCERKNRVNKIVAFGNRVTRRGSRLLHHCREGSTASKREYVLNAIQVRFRFTAHLSGINPAFVSLAWDSRPQGASWKSASTSCLSSCPRFSGLPAQDRSVFLGFAFGIVTKALSSILYGALCPTIRTASTSI